MECGRPGLVIIVVLAYGVRMAVAIWPGLSSRFCWFCPCWVKVHGKRVVGVTVAQKETGDDLSCQRRPPCRCPEEWRWVWATCRLYLPSPEQPQRGIGRMCRHRLGVERVRSPTACPWLGFRQGSGVESVFTVFTRGMRVKGLEGFFLYKFKLFGSFLSLQIWKIFGLFLQKWKFPIFVLWL